MEKNDVNETQTIEFENTKTGTLKIYTDVYIKQEPRVTDDGIYMPYQEYVPEGCASNYRLVMTKEMFVEAYNKWIKGV